MQGITHILFDFFGTLVSYSESGTEEAYVMTYDLLVAAGCKWDYAEFLASWDGIFLEYHRRAQASLDEYSMDEVCRVFLERALARPPDVRLMMRFRDTYLKEWDRGIGYVPGLIQLMTQLSARYVLALVSNTCHAPLVRGRLQTIGLDRHFAAVLTSVEHGKRKPSHCIFERALKLTGGKAGSSLYVGDSYEADYLGALGAGLGCLLIDPDRRYDVPPHCRMDGILDLREKLLC